MKKLILSALLALVFLSSCSKALYNDKYDWVKVDRVPQSPKIDSLKARTTILTQSLPETAMQVYEKHVQKDSAVIIAETGLHGDGTEQAPSDTTSSQVISQDRTVNVMQKTEMSKHRRVKKGFRAGLQRKGWFKDIDWAEVLWQVTIGAALLLLWIYRDNPTVILITLILEAILALGSIIAIIWVMFWICKIFVQFVCMMDH